VLGFSYVSYMLLTLWDRGSKHKLLLLQRLDCRCKQAGTKLLFENWKWHQFDSDSGGNWQKKLGGLWRVYYYFRLFCAFRPKLDAKRTQFSAQNSIFRRNSMLKSV